MKFFTFLVSFLFSLIAFAQNEYSVFVQNKKNGLKLKETPYDTVVKANYQRIFELDSSFLLCENINYPKKEKYPYSVKNAIILDGQLKSKLEIDKADIYPKHVIDYSKNKQDVYSLFTGNKILEGVEIIDVIFTNFDKNTYGLKSYHNYKYLILYQEANNYKCLNQDHEVVVTFPFQSQSLKWDKEKSFYYYGGNKDYAVYDNNYNLLAEHIESITSLEVVPLNYAQKFWVMKNKNGEEILFKNKRLIKKIEGDFLMKSGNNNRFVFKEKERYFVIDSTGEKVTQEAYLKLYPSVSKKNTANLVQDKTKEYYFVDHNYAPISDDRFAFAEPLLPGEIYNYFKVKLMGEIDSGFHVFSSSGEKLTQNHVDNVLQDKDGLIIAEKNGRKAFLNWNDEWSTFEFDKISMVKNCDDFIEVWKSGQRSIYSLSLSKWFVSSKQYKQVQAIVDYAPSTLVLKSNNDLLLISSNGKEIITTSSLGLTAIQMSEWNFIEIELGYFIVKNDKKWGVIFNDGKEFKLKIPFDYDELFIKSEILDLNGWLKVRKDDKYGVIDLMNRSKEIVPTHYDDILLDDNFIDMTGEEFLIFKKNTYYGIYNIVDGEEFVPPILKKSSDANDVMIQFHDMYAEKSIDCKVNRGNKECVFSKGMACFDKVNTDNSYDEFHWVENNSLKGLLNFYGDTIIDIQYSALSFMPDHEYFVVNKRGKKGILDFNGVVLIDPAYEEIEYNDDWMVYKVQKDKQWGVVNSAGETIIDTQYEALEIYGDHAFVQLKGKWGAYIMGDEDLTNPIDFNSLEALKEELGY